MFRLCLPACMEYVQMFHSCTPKAVKDLIIEDMKSEEGMFRILICTNAAGMGVNFHGVNHIIGRGGRSGKQAYHLLLTTKQQLRHTDQELREYALNDKMCRRDVLLTNYTLENRASVVPHICCDICVCNCGSIDCSSERFVHLAQDSGTNDSDSGDCMEDDDSDCTDLYE
ncbi:hypothetical protein MAR_003382 [Mya arenaria]|uniref:Helicase C-terminal domain-containing protein n=1 Tax=Mya arenaria TaxID=6604 RepID=A0ABY7G8X2_MYAAR|nr:hypothetical protein MAR_003382 [Mya arenaria]